MCLAVRSVNASADVPASAQSSMMCGGRMSTISWWSTPPREAFLSNFLQTQRRLLALVSRKEEEEHRRCGPVVQTSASSSNLLRTRRGAQKRFRRPVLVFVSVHRARRPPSGRPPLEPRPDCHAMSGWLCLLLQRAVYALLPHDVIDFDRHDGRRSAPQPRR